MVDVLQYTVASKIEAATAAAEMDVFNELSHAFRKKCLKRFVEVKDAIEDWKDAPNQKALFAQRLQTIAAKPPNTWTENSVLDMAIIPNILWNIVTAEEPEEPE